MDHVCLGVEEALYVPATCATHWQQLPRPRDLDSNFPEKNVGGLAPEKNVGGLAWMADNGHPEATTANTRLLQVLRLLFGTIGFLLARY